MNPGAGPWSVLAGALAGLAAVALAAGTVLLLTGAVLADPAWLALGFVAPAVAALEAAGAAARRRAARRLGDPDAVGKLVEHGAPRVRTVRTFLASSGLLLLAVAAARPQWGHAEVDLRRTGVDVMVCVDTSASMLADDVRPSRLARARLEVASLIDRLRGDRVGIVAFSGDARVLCPLTLDHSTAKLFLDLLTPDLLQRPGTAIGQALRVASRSFPEDGGRHSVVVLITDGEDHEGIADEAARELAELGVVVHCVGIGRTEGVPIPMEDEQPDGTSRVAFLRDEDGQVVMSRLDAATLQGIAERTDGTFMLTSAAEWELDAIAAQIAEMEGQELAARTTRSRTERYWGFLAAALALLALEAFLPDGARLRAGPPRRRATVERVAA